MTYTGHKKKKKMSYRISLSSTPKQSNTYKLNTGSLIYTFQWMPHNKSLTLDDGYRCLCISILGKIIGVDRILTTGPKSSYKYNATYMID